MFSKVNATLNSERGYNLSFNKDLQTAAIVSTMSVHLPKFREGPPLSELRRARRHQKSRARQRNVEYLLSPEEFIEFWSMDDRWKRRGIGADDFVMSRFDDDGPYSVDNIFCQTQRENGREASDRRNASREPE